MTADPLDELAESVCDGEPVDWQEAERAAEDDRELAVVRALKAIAEISEACRTWQEGAEVGGAGGDGQGAAGQVGPRAAGPGRAEGNAGSGGTAGTAERQQAVAGSGGTDGTGGTAGAGALGGPGGAAGRAGSSGTAGRAGTGGRPRPAVERWSALEIRWGHLEILEKIGAGSFGEVYRARDLQLHREVALKLLRPEASPGEAGDRALAEARLLARVRHTNVATVYGADSREGRVGFWMELIEGRTLADVVAEQGPLGAREAAGVGIELCRALAAVHASGIVHRDVKAQNVMREQGGRIVLTDFGIGKDVRPGSEEERTLAGTPLYLAPEILAGGAATVRSDVYALGVLLFYLVTGSFPLSGRSLRELRTAHEKGEARLLRDVRPDLPEDFVRAVERALAKDPAERYASMGAFEKALATRPGEATGPRWPALPIPLPADPRARRLAIAAAAAALLTVLVLGSLWVLRKAEPRAPLEKVLVADFENRTDIPLFGAARHLVMLALDQSPRLRVLSQESIAKTLDLMRRPRDSRLDLDLAREIGQREGFGILITGEITRGDKDKGYALILTATDPQSGTTRAVYREELQRPDSLVSTIDQLAVRLRHDLGEPPPEIERNRRPLEQATTSSLPALEQFTRALDLQTKGELEEAIDSLKLAVELDPEFALAYSRLAVYLGGLGRLRESLAAAEKAYAQREQVSQAESFRISGTYRRSTLQYALALESYQRAMDFDPKDADSSRQVALLHINLGKAEEGITAARKACERNPENVVNCGVPALILAIAGKPDEALAELNKARRELGDKAYFYWPQGLACIVKGDSRCAESAFRILAQGGKERDREYASYGRLFLAQTLAYQGRLQEAASELDAALGPDSREGYERARMVGHELLARIHFLLGDLEEARRQVEQLEAQVQDVPSDLKNLRWAALLRVRLGDVPEAERLLARIEPLRDSYPSKLAEGIAAQVRGEIQRARGNLSAARRSLEQAREDWEDPSTLASLARIRAEQVRCGQAVPLYQEILRQKGWIFHEYFAGDWVLAHLELAQCQSRLGQVTEARKSYDEFLRLWGKTGAKLAVVQQAHAERAQLPPN